VFPHELRLRRGGRLVELTDPNGNATGTAGDGTTSYSYDRAGRLTDIDYSDSTPDVGFDYDNAGNRTEMTDGAGTVSYSYDNLDRLTDVSRGSNSFCPESSFLDTYGLE
jgi:YD repeat-containing protein